MPSKTTAKRSSSKTTAKRSTRSAASSRSTSRTSSAAKKASASSKSAWGTNGSRATGSRAKSASAKRAGAGSAASAGGAGSTLASLGGLGATGVDAISFNTNGVAKPINKKLTQAETIRAIANTTGISQQDVKNIFNCHNQLLEGSVKGVGEFVLHQFGIKVRRVQKAAKPARMGRNPATGEEIRIPAKKASKAVKLTALKALKEVVVA